ncbi:MAG: integrase [Acidiphilium sp. 37-64-53]|uniref:tyrosine-type recombinase/integrase n=2 Tax=Acidocellaceae TaxID=3385905 RepID=UPI000BC9B650|nr:MULTISPECIES: integrase arm-type DNA-binding domain-containing protein [Acidiphilium]OYW00230.1 MAG: integrase [Acidiphilium sp. 37-64-53]OZB23891.1 MAG: integrase [Acidiphilium sp. 34-64-41]HQT86612.1 integrase arm-type DNA-binding domain-containing protein [Acidiphilium rubrum]
MSKLTDRAIKAIKADGRYGDGRGLWFVRRGGSTAWHFRWMREGKARECSLGAYPVVTLAEARTAALDARRLIAGGGDPIEARKASKATGGRTFESVALEYIEAHKAGWRNAKHGAQWLATLAAYAFPIIGAKPVQAVTTDDILAILKPLWQARPETATRLRGRVESVLDYAKSRGWRAGENPAAWRGHLDNLLPARSKVSAVVHHAAVAWRDLPGLYERIAAGGGISSRCLAFTILTAARSGEARGCRWDEIDLDARAWTIPGSRMKAGKPHRVPLSDAAVAILSAMQPLQRGADGLVFPGGVVGKPMSDVALNKALAAAGGEAVTVHGMRSTFRDWAAEATGTPREIAEAALAHTNRDKVEAAYLRGDHFDRRRVLMDAWAAHCERVPAANVVQIGARA